jgi:uncharacterized surface protein with fasciclin (FAS1) repeats
MFVLLNNNKFSLASSLLGNNNLFIERAKKINEKVFLIEGTEDKVKIKSDGVLIQDISIENNMLIIKNESINKTFNLIEV